MNWIDTSDEVPPYGKRVLVRDIMVRIGVRDRTDKMGDLWFMEAAYTKPLSETEKNGVVGMRDVKYWMPLPP